jgi:CheY-like chemotaxis protein
MAPRHTVLIVEDDADLRRFLAHTLSMAGFDVREARGGFEALRRLDSDPPDIVVLDLMMPGMDGFTVRREIAAHIHTRHIPVVVVTGSAATMAELDVDCLLRKPITTERLIEAIRSCLASSAPPAN